MDASFRCRSSSGIAVAAAYEDSQLGCVGSILHFLHLHNRFHHHRNLLDTAARRQRKHREADAASGTKYSKLKRMPTAEEEYEFTTSTATENHGMEEFNPHATNTTAMPLKEKDKKKKEKKKKKKKSPAPKQLKRTLSIHYLECDDYVVREEKPPSARDDASSSCGTCEPASGTESGGSSYRVKSSGSPFSEKQPWQKEKSALEQSSPSSKERLAAIQTGRPSSSILQHPTSCCRHQMEDLQLHTADPMLSRSGSYPAFKNSERTRLNRTGSMDTPFLGHTETESDVFQSASGILQETKQEREDKSHSKALHHFKNIKKRIKDIIKEEKIEGHRISMDGLLHKVPYGQKPPSDLDGDDGSVTDKYGLRKSLWHDSAAYAGSRPKIHPQFRRSRSLSDSLEKYSYLLESINRESKEDMGERVKSSLGDTALFVMNRSKTLGRIYSLRESEPNSRSDDTSLLLHDISLPRRSINLNPQETTTASGVSTSVEQLSSMAETYSETGYSIEETSQQDTENSDCPSKVRAQPTQDNASENSDDSDELGRSPAEIAKNSLYHDGIMTATENDNTKPAKASPVSILETYSDEDLVSPLKFADSEVRTSIQVECLNNADSSDVDETCSGGSMEFPLLKDTGPEVHHFQVASKNEAEFNYVLNILRKSGFNNEEFLGKWFSPEQPINPSLYVDEIMNPEMEANESDADTDLYHLLLFDLMNEVLLEISMGSSSYDHRIPCISSQVRSIPFEYNLLPKVWKRINWHLNCQQKQYTKLDPAGLDGWMNLKYDMEAIGLELDKMIIDELLDEMIYGDLLEEAIAKSSQ